MTTLSESWEDAKSWIKSPAWGNHLFDQWINTVMVGVHFGLGVSLLIGGPLRLSDPTYLPVVNMVGGHTWVWGVLILFSGLLMLAPHRPANIFGLWVGMGWMIAWTGLFLTSVVAFPNSALLPVIACGGFAMIDTALLTARVINSASVWG